jgi:hypothetical protein
MGRTAIPLRQRRTDLVFLAFFVVNLFFITYLFDIEQITVANATDMSHYPIWPPRQMVDLVHWYGNHWDPLLMARPAFFKATIWIDSVLFGPFYAAAIYAFVKGRDWIRTPALVWAGIMMTNVALILSEEAWGIHRTPHLGFVVGSNAAWFLLPIAVIWRVHGNHPFTAPAGAAEPSDEKPAGPEPADPEPADPEPAADTGAVA